ncbi:MAG: serine hydrolase [Rhodobacteraceae bacterium]|nr:serine hydrolase [Paracoccaceae bacterium]
MTYRLTALALILSTVGCTTTGPSRTTHDSCKIVAPYAGPALRGPVANSVTHLRPLDHSGLTSGERSALAAAFAKAKDATGAPSITAAVWQEGGAAWAARSGTPDGHIHYWASVGKIITAAAVLRLELDGQLSLDDPIAKYVEGVPNGEIITLHMLMTHTSGLFSSNEDPQVYEAGDLLDLEGVLDVVRRQPPYACPGAVWRYSNSGYTLLGAVIENITGKPYHVAATELVLSRSAGQGIRMLAPNESLDSIVPPANRRSDPSMDLRGPQAAGGAAADAESMALFLRDLMSGRILPRETVARMLAELYPMHQDGLWYGLGLMVYDVPGPEAALWIGHSGGVPGARAVLVYAPEQDAIVAVALIGEGSAEATANLLLNALEPE